MPPIWVEQCPPGIHKDSEAGNGPSKEEWVENNCVPRRHAPSSSVQSSPEDPDTGGHSSPAAVGFHCQLGEVSPHAISGIDIPWVYNQLTEDADKLATRKALQDCVRMFASPPTAGSFGEGAEQTHRHDDSNNAGCPSSPTVLPESTEDKEPSIPSDTRVCLQGESGLHLMT